MSTLCVLLYLSCNHINNTFIPKLWDSANFCELILTNTPSNSKIKVLRFDAGSNAFFINCLCLRAAIALRIYKSFTLILRGSSRSQPRKPRTQEIALLQIYWRWTFSEKEIWFGGHSSKGLLLMSSVISEMRLQSECMILEVGLKLKLLEIVGNAQSL